MRSFSRARGSFITLHPVSEPSGYLGMKNDGPMILPAITAGSVQEHNVLSSLTGLLVEDLALAPQRRSYIDVTSNDAVLFGLILLVRGRWTRKGIVKEFQSAAPDVCPASEGILRV
jgi:hypothetical protein